MPSLIADKGKKQQLIKGTNLSSDQQKHTFIAAWLGEMFDGMDASIFALVLFPAVSELIHSKSYSEVGFCGSIILATFLLGYALGGIIFGALADRIGRARVMVFSILIYALSTGLCALSNNWQMLALCRFIVGLGIGGELAVGAVLVSESALNQHRLFLLGLLVGSFSVGYFLAALFNFFVGGFSWRYLFLIGVIPAFITLYIRAKVKESAHFINLSEYRNKLKEKSQANLTRGEQEILKPSFWTLFQKGSRKNTLVILTVSSTALIGYWVVAGWIPAWINQLTGCTAVHERSTTAMVLNVGCILVCLLASSIINKLGRKGAFILAFSGALIASVCMFLTIKSFGIPLLVYAFFIGAFATLPFAAMLVYLPELYATRIRSTAVGFTYNAGRIIAAVGALISGQLIATFGGSYAKASACVAVCYLVGLCFSFLLPKTNGMVEEELFI